MQGAVAVPCSRAGAVPLSTFAYPKAPAVLTHSVSLQEGSSYLSALEQTHLFLSRVECVDVPELDDELLAQLDGEQLIIREEIDVLRARIDRLKEELEAIWRDARVVEYELTSVFIHRGSSPSWGHYFFYSRNLPAKPDEWFKYNDSDVSVVDKAEVLADTTGSTANPYLVCFCFGCHYMRTYI